MGNNFIYNFDRKSKIGNCWRCVERSCLGRIVTDCDKKSIIKESLHSHSSRPETNLNSSSLKALKQSVTKQTIHLMTLINNLI
jgi:hypothetical protein